MNNIASRRPLLDGKDLDTAIIHARAALEALLRDPDGTDGAEYPKLLAEARALLAALLDRAESLARARSWDPWGLRPLRLAATLI